MNSDPIGSTGRGGRRTSQLPTRRSPLLLMVPLLLTLVATTSVPTMFVVWQSTRALSLDNAGHLYKSQKQPTEEDPHQQGESTNNKETTNKRKTTAIVFKTKTIRDDDTCLRQLFMALVLGTKPDDSHKRSRTAEESLAPYYQVILLHEPTDTVSDSLLQLIQQHSHVRVMSNPIPSTETSFAHSTGKSKLSFLLWVQALQQQQNDSGVVTSSTYEHYWLVEDDVFFTGHWGHFFQTTDARVTAHADFVSNTIIKEQWWRSRKCRVNNSVCHDETTGVITQSQNFLFRISHRFALHLVGLLSHNLLAGHDEANFPAACQLWAQQQPQQDHNNSTFSCQHAPLYNDEKMFLGYMVAGGWSVWQKNYNKSHKKKNATQHSPFSLQGLALLRHYQVPSDNKFMITKNLQQPALYAAHTDIPRNLLFHPIKCSGDPTMGEAALAFAAGW